MTNDKNDRDAAVDRLLAATLARDPSDSTGACLDAETLAAWADNALDAGERAAAEAHAADCARCQAMLAAMVRTAPATDAATSPWRLPSLRWLVPLTAAAAALIIWMVVPMRDMGQANVRQVSQSAESTPVPAGPAATDAVDPTEAGSASGGLRRESDAAGLQKKVAADNKAVAPTDANAVADKVTRSSEARLKERQAAAQGTMAARAAPMGTPAAPPPAETSPAPAAKAFSFDAPAMVIVSSNPASRWRIIPGGAVQRSADGGATWQMQDTGVTETLAAGYSPSPSVCWLVGPGGIVLLSIDGRSWKRVAFPEATPLVSIRATDEQTATVTTADGRDFVTEDGGRNWVRSPRF